MAKLFIHLLMLHRKKEFLYSSSFSDQLHKIQDEEGIDWKHNLILDRDWG